MRGSELYNSLIDSLRVAAGMGSLATDDRLGKIADHIISMRIGGASMTEWQPIESAPKDGTIVDLWIVGQDDTVDFYAATAAKIKGKPLRHGRTTNFRWLHKPPNEPAWYPHPCGLGMYPLAPEVTVTHWMPLPLPPTGD